MKVRRKKPDRDPTGCWLIDASGSEDKHYTYTIITTDSNKQLSFLHDRMPVILENGSDALRTWLDPKRSEWSKELQSLLKPYDGQLDCYPVSKEVGKVGNNSPTFIVPVASTENKNNIANFFGNAKKEATGKGEKKEIRAEQAEVLEKGVEVEHDEQEQRSTVDQSGTEDNAPLPIPSPPSAIAGSKRAHETDPDDETFSAKAVKLEGTEAPADSIESPGKKSSRKTRSGISNGTKGSPVKQGDKSQKITSFFNK